MFFKGIVEKTQKVTGQVKVRFKVKTIPFTLSVTNTGLITVVNPNFAEMFQGRKKVLQSIVLILRKGQFRVEARPRPPNENEN